MTTQLAETLEGTTNAATRRRVFSGVQPSGDPQLGNYIGAFKQWVENQDAKENFFCIVDLHAITVEVDPDDLRRQTRELAAILFACGIDPGQKHAVRAESRDHARRGLLDPELRHPR